MRITKQDMDVALARLVETFPQTFVLEKFRPHRPLKIGINADIRTHCPAVERRVLSVVLRVYTRRVMYLQGLVAGAARIDLDGNPAGEVSVDEAEHAMVKLAGILASREAHSLGRKPVTKPPAPTPTAPSVKAQPAPAPKILTLKEKPVLRLAAFRR
jgi:ProP effector